MQNLIMVKTKNLNFGFEGYFQYKSDIELMNVCIQFLIHNTIFSIDFNFSGMKSLETFCGIMKFNDS